MMYVVDGTGPKEPQAYDREMSGGFCKRLEDLCGARYWRGPSLLGHETVDIAEEVVAAVVRGRAGAGSPGPLLLAGHSRGGAAVIFAAQALNERGIAVDAMFLFDAVDRTLNNFRDAQTVPGNVRHCYHALRDPSLAFYYSDGVARARDKVARCIGLPVGRRPSAMEDMLDLAMKPPVRHGPCAEAIRAALDLQQQDERMKLVMRSVTMNTADGWTVDFGNCGIAHDPACRLQMQKFLGSHGAIGGAPIVDQRAPRLLIDADRAAIASVRAWMYGHLGRHRAFVKAPNEARG